MIDNKQLYSVKEVADLLKISRIAVFNKIKNGKIKAEKIGRNYIIHKNEIHNLLTDIITDKIKHEIDNGVEKTIKQYGDVLKKLGKE